MDATVAQLLAQRLAEHGLNQPENAIPLTGIPPVDWAIRFHIERHDVTHILMEADNTPLGEAYVGGAEAASLGIPRLAAIVGFAAICRLDPDFDAVPRRAMLESMLRGYDGQLHNPCKIVTGQTGVYRLEDVLPLTLTAAQQLTGVVSVPAAGQKAKKSVPVARLPARYPSAYGS